MDATASFDQFTELAEQDGKVFVALLQASKDIASWWLRIFLLIFLSVPFLILAQFVPFIYRKHLSVIFSALPYIMERESLSWLKDAFMLYYYSLKGYRPFCLFRGSIDTLIDELDEQIDSLSFSLENQNFLQSAIGAIEKAK